MYNKSAFTLFLPVLVENEGIMNTNSDVNHVRICDRFNLLTTFLCQLFTSADRQVLSQVEGRVSAGVDLIYIHQNSLVPPLWSCWDVPEAKPAFKYKSS